ncbi:MAG: SAF domain-containing protein [Tomitella sp.]|nr:SAF domain-containing protein [Tomitella sp.]
MGRRSQYFSGPGTSRGGSSRGALSGDERLARRVRGDAARSLRAGPIERLRAAWRPGWPRTLLLRRALAATLLVAAVVLLFRGDPAAEPVDVVVAAHDLSPGSAIGPQDVAVVQRSSRAVPEGALAATDAVLGHTIAAPVREGESLTDVRLLGTRLAQSAAGVDDARLVTIRLADPAVAAVVHAGDLVDVIAAPPGASPDSVETHGVTLAKRAPVVLVPPAPESRSNRGRVLLVALPAATAETVAGASMTRAMTVTVQ